MKSVNGNQKTHTDTHKYVANVSWNYITEKPMEWKNKES